MNLFVAEKNMKRPVQKHYQIRITRVRTDLISVLLSCLRGKYHLPDQQIQ